MKIIETSSIGAEVLEDKRQTIILGISINNSYFKEDNLAKLFGWAQFYALSTYIMIPDEPMISTLQAVGYDLKKATTIARLKANNLENKICRILILRRIDMGNVKIIRWKDISSHETYVQALALLQNAYVSDRLFRADVKSATENVLIANGVVTPTEECIEIGSLFLLKELAFITYANVILRQEKVAYIYHKTTEVLKNIFDGKYSFVASRYVGFATVL